MYQSFAHPTPLHWRYPGQTGLFISYSLDLSSPVVDKCTFFFSASLYHAGAEREFGWDFACVSSPLSQDWVQVACPRKTWRPKNWWRSYDFNRLTTCFWLDFSAMKEIMWKLPLTSFETSQLSFKLTGRGSSLRIFSPQDVAFTASHWQEKWMPRVSRPLGKEMGVSNMGPLHDPVTW